MSLKNYYDLESNFSRELVRSVENIRIAIGHNEADWLDLLELSWVDYLKFKSGLKVLPTQSLQALAQLSGYNEDELLKGNLDYDLVAETKSSRAKKIPDRYMLAPYGRCRTTHTSLKFIEEFFSWRLKMDALDKFNVAEAALQDPFSPISITFITDLCEYLAERQVSAQDFYRMGAYSYLGNKDTILARFLSDASHPTEVLEQFWSSCIELFERNCHYKFLSMGTKSVEIEVRSNSDIAKMLGVYHLGNKHICQLKAGVMASAPAYIGLPCAIVQETQCAHQGAESCIFHIDLQPSLAH